MAKINSSGKKEWSVISKEAEWITSASEWGKHVVLLCGQMNEGSHAYSLPEFDVWGRLLVRVGGSRKYVPLQSDRRAAGLCDPWRAIRWNQPDGQASGYIVRDVPQLPNWIFD